MKIVAIGFYDDSARFFLSIKQKIKVDNKIKFKFLSLYFSGFLYWILRDNDTSFFSLKAWLNVFFNRKKYNKIIDSSDVYQRINLSDIIKYNYLLDNKNEKLLKLQAISYIDLIAELLIKEQPDVIIHDGDVSRMAIEIISIKAKELNIKCFYFEQGPFNTTIFDHIGVNANASIRNDNINDIDYSENINSKINSFINRKKEKKFKRNPVYRGSDYIIQFLFSKTKLVPIDIIMEAKTKINQNAYSLLSKYSSAVNTEKNVFLLILQVPFDVNMLYHSPFYSDHYSIVKDIFNKLPQDSILKVREHPLYKNKYETSLYEYMLNNNIFLDDTELYTSIKNANVVIVNNSTVGIESIFMNKPTIVLGNAYYDRDDICLKLKDRSELNDLLLKSLLHTTNKVKIISFMNYFLFTFLIKGHFRDKELKMQDVIINKIGDTYE